MKSVRHSVTTLMMVVAVVAINLAIARGLARFSPLLPIAIAFIALALQAISFILIRHRGKGRAFWLGFLAFGFMAMMSVIWAIVFAPNIGIAQDPTTGETITLKIPGSFLWSLWSSYTDLVDTSLLQPFEIDLDPTGLLAAMIWSFPQFLLAAAGGLVVWLITARRGKIQATPSS